MSTKNESVVSLFHAFPALSRWSEATCKAKVKSYRARNAEWLKKSIARDAEILSAGATHPLFEKVLELVPVSERAPAKKAPAKKAKAKAKA